MRDRGMIYKVVVQTVLIYGINSWVVMGDMLKVLEGFHHWEAWKIAGMTARRMEDRAWDYPLMADTLEAAGIWPIK